MNFFSDFINGVKKSVGRHDLQIRVDDLTSALKIVYNNKSNSQEIKSAAKKLHDQLVNADKKFEATKHYSVENVRYPRHAIGTFAQECHAAICEHQPVLMADPGLWNYLKAYINSILEYYLECGPIFSTTYSRLALENEDFCDAMETIKTDIDNAREEATPFLR